MDLLRKGRLEFLAGVSELVVPGTVVMALAVAIHHGDQILGIFRDQAEHFFLVGQLPANTMDQDLLVNCVQVEQKNQSDQAANGLPEGERKFGIDLIEYEGKEAIPTVNRSVITIAEAHSHHCRRSTVRTRDQNDGS